MLFLSCKLISIPRLVYIPGGQITSCISETDPHFATLLKFAKDGGAANDPPTSIEEEFTNANRFNPGDGTEQFNVPHGVYANSTTNLVYVADSANNRLKLIDTSDGTMAYDSHI